MPAQSAQHLLRTISVLAALLLLAGSSVSTATASGEETTPERMIVVFDRLPTDAVARLRAEGITNAALFPAADAASVVGPASAYEAIAGWGDVVTVYPEGTFETASYEAKVQTGVSKVHAGGKPLKGRYTG